MRNLRRMVGDAEAEVAKAALKDQSDDALMDDFNLFLSCEHAAERNRTSAERKTENADRASRAAWRKAREEAA